MTTSSLALHVEADRSAFLEGGREVFSLSVTPKVVADRHWPRGLPGPLQLERAIEDVETAIEQVRLSHADRGALLITDRVTRLLPDLLRQGTHLGRDDVEDMFALFVASSYAGGRGGAGLELSGESAAALLLLREVMHHLGFTALATQG